VARLKAAGAIVIGKTNIPTLLADWQSANPVHGVTRNPWNLSRTPGGSSGGGAAALAAGFVSLEYGSDLSSSLRAPAHFCGIYAHKPSFDLVPTRGFAPPGTPVLSSASGVDMSVVGPMARSAEDLALALGVTAGPDDRDAIGYRLALPPPRHEALKDYRVLVLDRHPLVPTASSITGTLEARASALAAMGCRVGRASPHLPDLGEIADTFVELLMAALSGEGPAEPGSDASSHRDWIAADRRRAAIAHQWRALFQDWDVVLCPAMPVQALALNGPDGPAMIEIDGAKVAYEAQSLWGPLASLTGNPATAMPSGLDADGLPIGLQAVGPHLEDRTTIAFAGLSAREFGGFTPPATPWRG